jgi:cytochrome c553
MMNGPALQYLPDWYIVRQLKNYKAGIRGADPRDIEGMQMAPMSKTVPDEATMKGIAAYINSHAVSE